MKQLLNVLLAGVVASCSNFSQPTIPADYVIEHVNVIPISSDTVLEDQTLIIHNNEIVYLGNEKVKTSDSAQVINGYGKFMMPGMCDMHVHLPKKKEYQKHFNLYLANGITKIRSMRGKEEHLELKKSIEKGEILSPEIYYSAPPFSRTMEFTSTEVDSLLAKYKKDGFDFIKLLSIKDSTHFENLVKSAQKYGMKISGHMPHNVGLKRTLETDIYGSIEHLGGYTSLYTEDKESFQAMLTKTIEQGVYNCATIDFYDTYRLPKEELLKKKGLQYFPDQVKKWKEEEAEMEEKYTAEQIGAYREKLGERVDVMKAIIKKIDESGGQLLLSPSADGKFGIPGFSLVNEAQIYADAGISNYTILKMLTSGATDFMGMSNSGTIAKGKKADLILLDANPLTQINHLNTVSMVWLNGKLLETQALLQEVKPSSSN